MKLKAKIGILIFISIFTALPLRAETLKVVTKENAIREGCRFFSPVKVPVRYNDILEVVSTEGDWLRVKFQGKEGCIHKTAVKERTFAISGIMGGREAASEEEIALAGKGFNPEVEKSYRKKYPKMNYELIDRIERYRIAEGKVQEFIRNGALRQP